MPWKDWIRTVEVEPSLYAADFARLGEQIELLLRAGARIFHFDMADGRFVPPITVGPIVLEAISPLVHRFGGRLDCHLMVEKPERHFEAIAAAGGDSVTFHYEAVKDLPGVVRTARAHGLGVGLAFNPDTGPEEVAGVAGLFDLMLCMSINPGYSGQEFMSEAPGRIQVLRTLIPPDKPIQVDGGVGPENIRLLRYAGASLFVAGTSIFGREDIVRAYRRLVDDLDLP